MVDLTRMIQGGMDLATAFGRGDQAYQSAMSKTAQMESLILDARQKQNAAKAREEGASLLRSRGTPESSLLAIALEGGLPAASLGVGSKSNEAFTLSPGSKRFSATGEVLAEVPFAPANMQYVDIPDGYGGTVKALLNPRTAEFQSPQFGGGSVYEDGSPMNVTRGVGPNGTPFNFDPSMPADDRAAAIADMMSGSTMENISLPTRDVTPQQFGAGRMGYTPPKTKDAPSGYNWAADGSSMEMIPGGPAQVAAEARDAARQARQDAADAKAITAKQGETTRQREAAETSNSLVAALDRLEKSPGFSGLGSVMGDFKQGVPYFRNDVKDSQAQLENIRSQVVLATMSRLKALSATGATGFGALSEKEMGVLQNALATLDSANISNTELKASIQTIRESMQKVSKWTPSEAAPIDDARRALLDKY